MRDYSPDLNQAIRVLSRGGIILYPTDTIWGIGCDATFEEPVKRIYRLKNREEKKSMIILLPSLGEISKYVDHPPHKVLDFLSNCESPTTAIFSGAKNLSPALVNEDGTIAIRIVREPFCIDLLSQLGKPLVSTSANISGHPSPSFFKEVESSVRDGVDYIVKYRQDDTSKASPSHIIKMTETGEILRLR